MSTLVDAAKGSRYNILPAMTHEGYIAVDIYLKPVTKRIFMEFLEFSLVSNPPLHLHTNPQTLLSEAIY